MTVLLWILAGVWFLGSLLYSLGLVIVHQLGRIRAELETLNRTTLPPHTTLPPWSRR